MTRSVTLVALLVATILFSAPTANQAVPEKPALMLSVTLDTIYNHHFQISLPVTVGQPFKIVTTNGAVTNTISGTVGAPVQGKYPLPLYVSEWAGKTDNISETSDYNLELDKAVSGGLVSSFVFLRTVKLSQAP